MPQLIGWACLQWPPVLTLAPHEESPAIYGQVYARGFTDLHRSSPAPGLRVQIGYGPHDEDPHDPHNRWLWFDHASYHKNTGIGSNNQEFQATLRIASPGFYRYTFRYALHDGPWFYGKRSDSSNAALPGFSPEPFGSLAVVAPGSRLRVASFNLHGTIDRPHERFAAIARAFRSQQIDLIALQEVCQSPGEPPSSQIIADHLHSFPGPRYSSLFVPTHAAGSPPHSIPEGIGLLSRYPILDAFALDIPSDLPPPPGSFPRKLLLARCLTPLGVLTFASTHLDHRPDNESWRVRQTHALKTILASSSFSSSAILLGGDFNAHDPSPSIQAMTSPDQPERTPGYIDLLAPFDPGPTFPNPHPSIRIDYLFFHPNSPSLRWKASHGQRLFAQPVGDLYLSDHAGILAELQSLGG